ncbi:MAG: hypothetical protein Q7K40_01225 [bacterium]|nr:hypothetical protein [bacterium]
MDIKNINEKSFVENIKSTILTLLDRKNEILKEVKDAMETIQKHKKNLLYVELELVESKNKLEEFLKT